ncbi:hypothetical protein PFICI_07153 [Pestalotiopsis fici W106-1]|uniref:Uncharacterized protein n=1 Tax=Pestalotiopsis fici (strain W106-1 / CGMCC3.15140) TaxID=1229662 RepID=W3XAF9_PESFW|nr:uncharacterized protein PFICI_07153 [Pestalotiopsis fici W106-1]ETS82151.1 hypothetical protein PFICI_07153 [Pestalotiopsis fici W106-1]
MPVMSGSGAAQEIREFEEAHNIRRAVIVGLQRHLSSSHLPDYFNGGFDAIVISHSSIKFFYEFLCGPPETNIFVQYGCLTEEEQRWYSQRYERYHVGCEGSLTTSYGVQTPGLYTSVMPAQTLPRYVTARRREASIFSFRASKYQLTEDTNENMAE